MQDGGSHATWNGHDVLADGALCRPGRLRQAGRSPRRSSREGKSYVSCSCLIFTKCFALQISDAMQLEWDDLEESLRIGSIRLLLTRSKCQKNAHVHKAHSFAHTVSVVYMSCMYRGCNDLLCVAVVLQRSDQFGVPRLPRQGTRREVRAQALPHCRPQRRAVGPRRHRLHAQA